MNEQEKLALPEGFEDPNYGGGQYQNWALKDGTSLVLRILPPMKSLRGRKDYGQFWYTHFWEGNNPKDPGKRKSHPVLCIQEKDFRQGGMIVKRCPLCDKRNKYQDRLKAIEAAGRTKGASKQAIAKAQQPVNVWLKNHGNDGKWRLYVIDKQGKLGVLRITHTCMKQLREEVKKLLQKEINPMGVRGIWWEFTRVGTGFQTKDNVQPARISRPDGSEVYDFHVLTAEIAAAALEALPDLNEEMERIRRPDEVLEQLANTDDPAEVNRILGIRDQAEEGDDMDLEGAAPAEGGEAVSEVDDSFDEPKPAARAAAKPATPPPAEEPAVEEEDEEAVLARKMAELKAKKAAAAKAGAKPAAPAAAAPKVTPKATESFDPATASDEDFEAAFAE